MQQMTVVEALVARLKDAGLQRIFGVPGGGSSMDLIDAARRAGIEFVLSRREDSGMVMAGVTALLSNAPGLALGTKGPGVTSSTNGVASAYLDRAPVLFVSDGFGADEMHYVSHQYFDQAAVLGPITKDVSLLNGADPVAEIDALIETMTRAPKGPCYVELTGGAAKREIDVCPARSISGARGTTLNIGTVQRAQGLLADSRRPVVIAGLEAATVENAAAVRKIVGALNAPVLLTYMAKGVVPDQDLNYAGIFTGGQAEFACVSSADIIVLTGLDPVELIRKPWAYDIPVLDIGEVRHEKHYTQPACGLYGPIAGTVERLSDSLRVRPETLCRITEFSEHESNGRELDEGERVAVEVLPVLGQSAAAVEPGDGAFDHPTPGLDDEALHPIGSLDDLGLEIGQDAGQGAVKDRALIGAVGEQFPKKGKQTEQGRQQRETAVAILNVGGGDDAVQQQALRID